MRKHVTAFLAVTAVVSSFSMHHNPATDLLEEQDYERMRTDNSQGPSLSGPLVDGHTTWASYNQWLCFTVQEIDIACAEAKYAEKVIKVPVLHVTEDSHYFEFSMDPEPAPDCDKITARWKALLQDESAFCVYAAPLQELDISAYDTHAEAGSLWIVNQLKTSKGYWHFESDENWLRDEDDEATLDES